MSFYYITLSLRSTDGSSSLQGTPAKRKASWERAINGVVQNTLCVHKIQVQTLTTLKKVKNVRSYIMLAQTNPSFLYHTVAKQVFLDATAAEHKSSSPLPQPWELGNTPLFLLKKLKNFNKM